MSQTLAGILVIVPVAAMLCEAGNAVMIAVTISVAMSTRRSRIAFVIRFTPTADGAGCCVQMPSAANGSPWRASSAVGRGWCITSWWVVQRVTEPSERSRPGHPAQHAGVRHPPWEGGKARDVPGRGVGRGGVRRKVVPPYRGPPTYGNRRMTTGHFLGCDHVGVSRTAGRVLLATPRGYCAGVER